MRDRLTHLLLFLSFTMAFSAVVAGALRQEWFRLGDIILVEVPSTEESMLSADFSEVQQSLRQELADYLGEWIWNLSLQEVQQQLLKDVRLAEVQVQRWFPNKLKIEIKQRSAVVGLMTSDGVFPVALDGTLLPKISLLQAHQFPILRGPLFHTSLEARKRALQLVASLPRTGLFSQAEISEIFFHPEKGYRLYLNRSQREILLRDESLGPKASQIEKVLRYLESESIKGRVIDARLSKKVVVRLRNDS